MAERGSSLLRQRGWGWLRRGGGGALTHRMGFRLPAVSSRHSDDARPLRAEGGDRRTGRRGRVTRSGRRGGDRERRVLRWRYEDRARRVADGWPAAPRRPRKHRTPGIDPMAADTLLGPAPGEPEGQGLHGQEGR